jgi:hypothetical protein
MWIISNITKSGPHRKSGMEAFPKYNYFINKSKDKWVNTRMNT